MLRSQTSVRMLRTQIRSCELYKSLQYLLPPFSNASRMNDPNCLWLLPTNRFCRWNCFCPLHNRHVIPPQSPPAVGVDVAVSDLYVSRDENGWPMKEQDGLSVPLICQNKFATSDPKTLTQIYHNKPPTPSTTPFSLLSCLD